MSTPTLREALAEALERAEDRWVDEHVTKSVDVGDPSGYRQQADDVLAFLADHPDLVLDHLGYEQVGWFHPAYGDTVVLARVPRDTTYMSGWEPVYARKEPDCG